MDKKAKKARKKKCKSWKKFDMSQNKVDETMYNKARNKATAAYRNAKIKYENSLSDNIKSNSKKFYAYVRSK